MTFFSSPEAHSGFHGSSDGTQSKFLTFISNLRKFLGLIFESATSSADLRGHCGAPGRSYGSTESPVACGLAFEGWLVEFD